jgi:hypothetical protein
VMFLANRQQYHDAIPVLATLGNETQLRCVYISKVF